MVKVTFVLFHVLVILNQNIQVFSKSVPESKKSVIIIGGGISALAAGVKLVNHGGFEVTLLEADDHVGGRVKSRKLGDYYLEFGAEWVHGESGNRVFEIMNSSGLISNKERSKSLDRFTLATQHGELMDSETKEKYREIYETISDSKTSHKSLGGKFQSLGARASYIYETMNAKTPIHPRKSMQRAFLDLIHRDMNTDDSSDSWFLASGSSEGEQFVSSSGNYMVKWVPPATYTTFIGVILGQEKQIYDSSQLDIPEWIKLNKEVTQVKYSTTQDKKVNVKCSDGSSYDADHVLSTVSLGVLKEMHLRLFNPNLPERKQLAIDALGFGTVNKIYLEFETQWWGNSPYWYVGFLWDDRGDVINGNYFPNTTRDELLREIDGIPLWSRSIVGFNAIDSNSHPYVLQGWISGVSSRFMETLDVDYVTNICTKLLRRFLYKYKSVPKPIRSARSTWFSNPFTRGTYSFRTVRSDEKNVWARDIAAPVVNEMGKPILTFAGEASSIKHYSTVHGAYDSGVREGKRLIEFYGGVENSSRRLIQAFSSLTLLFSILGLFILN